MKSQNGVRVIKREQRAAQAGAAQAAGERHQGLRHATRETAGNVAAWVREFQQRRPQDPRRAFASLFAEPVVS